MIKNRTLHQCVAKFVKDGRRIFAGGKNKSVAATALLCQCFASPVMTMSNIQQLNISTMSDHAPLLPKMKVEGTIWSNIQIQK